MEANTSFSSKIKKKKARFLKRIFNHEKNQNGGFIQNG
jgi:hypothetical protein